MMGKTGRAIVFATAAAWFLSAPALAATVDAATLTRCLLDHTTDDEMAAMKRLMIAALKEDVDRLKAETSSYGAIVVQLAGASCSVEAAQFTDPAVDEAVGSYLDQLSDRIIDDAFAKMQ